MMIPIPGLAQDFSPETVEAPETLTVQEIAKLAGPSVCLITTSSGLNRHGGTGTGFVVRDDGVIATNLHVIQGASTAVVKFPDGREFPVEGILETSSKDDLALLKVDATNLPAALRLADSDKVQVGQDVVVIGHPLGRGSTTTEGIISSILQAENQFSMSVPISPGSSGSPVLNQQGLVVAVAVATIYGAQNLNIAIPSNQLQELMTRAGAQPGMRALGDVSPGGGTFRWINLAISAVVFALIGFGVWRMNQAD